MRKTTVLMICAMMVFGPMATMMSGAIAAESPRQSPRAIFNILDVNDLQDMQNHLNDDCILMNDIDAGATVGWNNGDGFIPVGNDTDPFTGTFDGQNFTITNLFINNASLDYVGLFGNTSGFANITNLILDNASVTGNDYVGAVVGFLDGGNLTNCMVDCVVVGNDYVGGVGGNVSAESDLIIADVDVTGTHYVGGIFGTFLSSNLNNSLVTGYANSTTGNGQILGGLIGAMYDSARMWRCGTEAEVRAPFVSSMGPTGGAVALMGSGTKAEQCYASGDVVGSYVAGGFVGNMRNASVNDSFATGNVAGWNCIGGFAGGDNFGTSYYTNCYAAGFPNDLFNDALGGFTGYNNSAVFRDCFWDIDTSTVTIGDNEGNGQPDAPGIHGRSHTEMCTQSTFWNWTFDLVGDGSINNWTMAGYPHLQFENTQNIKDAADLQLMAVDPAMDYAVLNDFDAADTTNWNNGSGFKPVGNTTNPYNGSFEGNGFWISGLFLNHTTDNVGLFGYTGTGASIRDVVLNNTNVSGGHQTGGLIGHNQAPVNDSVVSGLVTGGDKVGGLIGFNEGGAIESCQTNTTVDVPGSQWFVGGLIGENEGEVKNCTTYGFTSNSFIGTGGLIGYSTGPWIYNCSVYGDVYGGFHEVGGLMADNNGGLVEWCEMYGNVTTPGGVIMTVGGFLGENRWGSVQNCTNFGNLNGGYADCGGFVGMHHDTAKIKHCRMLGTVNSRDYVGGFVGRAEGSATITECYSLATVSGNDRVGGFVGWVQGGATITDCYSQGDVSANDHVGGFAGYFDNGVLTNCYSTGLVNGNTNDGAFAGTNTGAGTITECHYDNQTAGMTTSQGGYGNTTKEMMSQATFDPPWDFNNVWGIHEANSYPYLQHFGALNGFLVNLTVTIDVSPVFTNTFQVFYMWLNVTNNGPNNASNVNVTVFDLNPGIYDIDHNMTGAFIWGTNGTWPVGTLWVGESAWAQLNMTVDNSSAGVLFDYEVNATSDYTEIFWPDNNDTAQVQVNSPPIAQDDTGTTDENTVLNVATPGVFANDNDPESPLDSFALDSFQDPSASGATVVVNANGSYSYDPTGAAALQALAVGEYVLDTFDYTIIDTKGNTSTATVTINVTGVNDAPTANDDTATLAEDGGPTPIDVLANDTDPDTTDTLLITAVTQGANGTVNITGGGTGLNYTPVANFNGIDTFTYNISDGNGGVDTATVTVNVTPVNDPPVATNDTATVAEDSGPTIIDVLTNDLDIDGDSFNITLVTQPANGTVLIVNNGTNVTYQPVANFTGFDLFTYNISDGNGGNATATVNVTVTGVNDLPIAEDDAVTVDEDSAPNLIDVLANDWDVEGSNLTITAVSTPDDGTAAIMPNGTWLTYEPEADFFGTDSFFYSVHDGDGGVSTAIVTVTVRNVNDPPTIQAATAPDGLVGQPYQFNLSATDIDGDTLSWSGLSNASWLRVNSNGVVNGTPTAAGTFWVNATVNDGQGGNDSINLTFTIEPDMDGDGITDALDDDRDGDGTDNTVDAFPDDSSEDTDTDGDGIGDNEDPDDDGDGVGDDDDPAPLDPTITGEEGGIGEYWWILIILVVVVLLVIVGLRFTVLKGEKAPPDEDDDIEDDEPTEVDEEDDLEPDTETTEVAESETIEEVADLEETEVAEPETETAEEVQEPAQEEIAEPEVEEAEPTEVTEPESDTAGEAPETDEELEDLSLD